MTDVFDGIGQKITAGDFVMSVRDGTGAKPRIVTGFTASKVRVSDWGTNTTVMDACNLVVITENLKVLQAAGSTFANSYLVDKFDEWKDKIETAAPKAAKAPPLRFMIVGHLPEGLDWQAQRDSKSIQFVSIHQVHGAGNDAVSTARDEATVLGATYGMSEDKWILHREGYTGYYQASVKQAWYAASSYGDSAKNVLWPLTQLRAQMIDGFVVNEKIELETFDAQVQGTEYKVNK